MSHSSLATPSAGLHSRGLPTALAGVLVAGCFALGLLAGQGALDGVGRLAIAAFKAVAESHYVMYQARENLAEDGTQEFAVLETESGVEGLRAFVEARAGWSLRKAFVPGWSVVSMPGEVVDGVDTLRGSGHVRAVLRNRGMWICH